MVWRHSFVRYRLPDDETMEDKSIGPLQDAQQAIRVVRENASKWNIDPAKIGVIGFSAGGHLALAAASICVPTSRFWSTR